MVFTLDKVVVFRPWMGLWGCLAGWQAGRLAGYAVELACERRSVGGCWLEGVRQRLDSMRAFWGIRMGTPSVRGYAI